MSSSDQNHRHSNSVGYDRWSDFYDTYPNPTVAIDELSFPSLWKNLRGKDVLEVGCGTGRHTRKLLDAGNRVVGVDPSAGMLAVARKKLQASSVTLIEADFMTYDLLEPCSFDAALASLVVEHIRAEPPKARSPISSSKELKKRCTSAVSPIRLKKWKELPQMRDSSSSRRKISSETRRSLP